ncbi:MAG: ATP-binding protein, partial [Candidatus Binatia bacterium]
MSTQYPVDHCAGAGFVGRERELAELRAGLEGACAGRGRLFLVAGEAGIGKTRLVEELAAEAARRGGKVLWGRCWEGEGAPPYWPWVQIIRSLLKNPDPEVLTAQMSPGAAYLAQLVPEIRERFLHIPAPPTSPDSEHARFYLFDAAASFLKNASTTTPLILIFDDLQWADAPSLLLLRFLARAIFDARILLVGTYREAEALQTPVVAEMLGALVRNGHHVPLRGLSEEEAQLFIEQIARGTASSAFVRTVYQKTEGNPFFVDEVVRVLAAEGALERTDRVTPSDFPLPQGVREAVRRRLAPLPKTCIEILTVASVVGREFDLASLQQARNLQPKELLQVLSAALASGVIVPNPGAAGRYRFSHVLIRETLYEGLAHADRLTLHRRIGQVLEEMYQANP